MKIKLKDWQVEVKDGKANIKGHYEVVHGGKTVASESFNEYSGKIPIPHAILAKVDGIGEEVEATIQEFFGVKGAKDEQENGSG